MLTRNPYILLLLLASFCLFSAYFVEYIMQLAACPLCIYQRFPYLIFIFISIIAVAGKEYEKCNIYLVITVIGAIILAGYHTGIERGVFVLSSLCKPLVSVAENISVHDFTKLLYSQKIAMCNKPALVIFNLSMTEWNLLLNIILLIFFIKYRNFQEK
ncbi:MAG: disulfide bond formation protein B [Alphaproteobacteria bacterium]|jgi:disulfide bond formation protein DsbB|nr:disulfide bond formation protein B [Alphaproteobacteria bacterium]